MFDIHRVELEWGGRKLVLETGKIARQADGAVIASYGDSRVLATVVAAKERREGVDFLPLTVDYQEKFYAAGRIPGGYFKREGRPTEKEALVSRLIDRPVRPLFAEGWRCETQVIVTTLSHALEKEMLGLIEQELRAAYGIAHKAERHQAIDAAKLKVMAHFSPEGVENPAHSPTQVAAVFKELEAKIVRWNILDSGKRIDGRDVKTVRPIVSEAGILPRAHGSALFTRGETQALVIATLGTGEDEQWIDALQGTYKETFLLHYNFPPFSVGETGRMGGPRRREIGHGKLAWRAIHPVLPKKEEFPYTIRVVSEITESNGSSSMATVCGSSLALMDAGVPLKRPTAGIAMGLILEDQRFAVLSEILGDEDHLGDMDVKVAGTDHGITSLPTEIQIEGITEEIMQVALTQAKDGRMHILGELAKALGSARAE